MDTIVKAFGEFGILAVLVVILLAAIGIAVRWLANNAILPMVRAGINYLNKQTEATDKLVEQQTKMAALEADIRKAIMEMRETHSDADSVFATVHTNASIGILAKAVNRVAIAVDADVSGLIDELESVLRRQHA